MTAINDLKVELSNMHGMDSRAFLFWKGRVGLYCILKACGIGPGDEVILPAFTCVVVPNAILYLGATPIYVDIDKVTLNAGLQKISATKTKKTRAVICQNTFGLSSEVDSIASWAKTEGIYSIEDCTHGFGGYFNESRNGTFCDAAFFSSQWNKPISTGLGGYVISKNDYINERLHVLESNCAKPSFKDVMELRLQVWLRKYVMNEFTYWTLLRVYRWLSSHNIVTGSSSGEEILGISMPKDFLKGMSAFQAKLALKELSVSNDKNADRKKSAIEYTLFLKSHDRYYVQENLHGNHLYLKYPLLVKDRLKFMKLAESARIELGDWFNSQLHPVQGDLSPWKLNQADFPVSQDVASHIVNLPTIGNLGRVIKFLEQNLDEII